MKYIDADKLKKLIDEKWKELADKGVKVGGGKYEIEIYTYLSVLRLIESLQQEQPLLPSNLDEAALKAYPKMSRLSEPHGVIPADNKTHYLGDANEENRAAFKAGAEWLAGQKARKEE